MGEVAVTYAELNGMSNRVARAIVAARSSDSEPIGLFFATGVVQIAAVLGVLKAGKFFVLLDSSFPKDRIAVILEDSQVQFLLADEQNISFARDAADSRCQVVAFESINDRISAEDLGLDIAPQALSHIVYTSGSTGRPKGVAWNHLNRLQTVMRRIHADQVCAQDKIAALSSVTANAVTNIFVYCYLAERRGASPFRRQGTGSELPGPLVTQEPKALLMEPMEHSYTKTSQEELSAATPSSGILYFEYQILLCYRRNSGRPERRSHH
jgi:non-ribosomal peptide synthetase component F